MAILNAPVDRDRAPIAQATVEDLVLVTTDEEIAHYASERLQVFR